MGIYLEILVSPFLNKGLISEYFSLSGNTSIKRTLLQMLSSGKKSDLLHLLLFYYEGKKSV
jgi:hypothetical protein